MRYILHPQVETRGLYLVFPILSEGIESCVGEEECRCLAWGEEQGSGQNRLAGSVWV
jgi:hypothetical protein